MPVTRDADPAAPYAEEIYHLEHELDWIHPGWRNIEPLPRGTPRPDERRFLYCRKKRELLLKGDDTPVMVESLAGRVQARPWTQRDARTAAQRMLRELAAGVRATEMLLRTATAPDARKALALNLHRQRAELARLDDWLTLQPDNADALIRDLARGLVPAPHRNYNPPWRIEEDRKWWEEAAARSAASTATLDPGGRPTRRNP
ncbi:MAG: hypothetical protein JXB39_09220 [Deltaproteobacteria bacterium]|nr:hypothetical protein [Deltaproteobacteria bacterium]